MHDFLETTEDSPRPSVRQGAGRDLGDDVRAAPTCLFQHVEGPRKVDVRGASRPDLVRRRDVEVTSRRGLGHFSPRGYFLRLLELLPSARAWDYASTPMVSWGSRGLTNVAKALGGPPSHLFAFHLIVGSANMPCVCVPGCGCGSASACAASSCVGALAAGATIAAMSAALSARYASLLPLQGRAAHEELPANYEAARAEFLRERTDEIRHWQAKLARLQSVRPIPFVRSSRRLRREVGTCEARISRLTHELSALES